MRYKKLQLSGLLLLGLGLTGIQAQQMYVKEKSGTQTAYALSNILKITFSEGNVTIQKTDNSNGVYALNELRNLNFTDLTTDIPKPTIQLDHSNLINYPNPVTDILNIDLTGIMGAGTISILTLDGKIMLTQKTNGNSLVSLNLSHLSQGIYLCHYVNALEIRTVKIIKKF